MISSKRQLIDEQTSPLHRIMWVYNAHEPARRSFENNISAFHIGNGYLLTVAHNLRSQAGFIKSIDLETYQKELLYKMDGSQKIFIDQHYFTDEYNRKLYLNNADQAALQGIVNILKQKRFDTRWETLAQKKICTPHLIVQFKENSFYKDEALTALIPQEQVFFDPSISKHTFLLEVELVKAFYGADIALYKIVNTPAEIIAKMPAIEINCDFEEGTPDGFHCLQSSTNNEIGRLLNEARIEGMLDHFGIFPDEIGGNYIFEGFRYLIKGYFRFGSSGAPYVYYDSFRHRYVANAIQSEASGIQVSIKNDREGNIQYVNAVASPLYIIKDELAALGIPFI